MEKNHLHDLLHRVQQGELSVTQAARELEVLPYRELEYATVDHLRQLRHATPEVVFGPGKSAEQIVGIVEELRRGGGNLLVTKVDPEKAKEVRQLIPTMAYDAEARALTLRQRAWQDRGRGLIVVVCAGTSDLPIAQEAVLTASMLDNRVERVVDVGVAGLHRILGKRKLLEKATVIVVAAGMEGALASVVGGLIPRPIIAVPTSIGYGASFSGLAALLGMLNSCSSGVTVTNIDNGFGAGYAASRINRRTDEA